MSVVAAIPVAVVVADVVAVVDAVVVASKRLAHSSAHAIPQARPAHAVPIRASMSVEARSRSRSRGKKYKGIIVEWRGDKGFGFVQGDEFNKDIFFLGSELPLELQDSAKGQIINQCVEYDVFSVPSGTR